MGGPPPPDAIYFERFCTLSVSFLTCFELSLYNPLVFLGFSWFSVDFSMISVAFLLIFRTCCSDFAEVLPDKRLGPILGLVLPRHNK